MRVAALCYTEMAGELAVLQAAMSSATESVLGCLPVETFWAKIVRELVTKFQKLEERCSRLERPRAMIWTTI
jgi:hypothetical protein